jgi:S-adenosylmethionine hydrolase
MPERKVISLLTDFGQQDGFVGVMKGVILGIAPEVSIVDISHEIKPHDVDAGAFVLRCAYRYFPAGTIHVGVIDPGVGSTRRILVAHAAAYFFVVPDNGLLSFIVREHADIEVYAVDNQRLFLETVSNTFHGRDIFAPVAAHLAAGTRLDEVGPKVHDYLRSEPPEVEIEADQVLARVLYIDHFGNVITNLPGDRARALGPADVWIHGRSWPLDRLARSYIENEPGKPILIVGSSDYAEIAVNGGNAANTFGLRIGDTIRLTARKQRGT